MSSSTSETRSRLADRWDAVWRSGRHLTVLVTVLAVLAVAAVVLTGAFGWNLYQQHRSDTARNAAVQAAKTTVIAMMSVSATSVDRDMHRVLTTSTGTFAQQYKANESQVRSAITENKVRARGTVLFAAVTSLDVGKSATVYIAADTVVHNVSAPKGTKTHSRVRATVADVNGTWLVSKIVFVA
jgi:Mce-associated membrane protein